MNPKDPKHDYSRVTSAIVSSIVESLGQPELDLDEGILRMRDHDEKCIWFGLYESDHGGDNIELVLATWSVEVSFEMDGGKQ